MNWYTIAQSNENIKLSNGLLGSHSGQLDMRILAMDITTNIYVGGLDYTIFQDELTVKWVEVLPEYRHRGIATMMYDHMEKENPEATYKPSLTTPEGSEFVKTRI